MRHLVFCAATALALTVGGCGVVGLGSLGSRTPSDRTLPKGPQAAGRSEPSRESSRKKVASKEAPNTLVADDRTICFVTPEDFRAISIGDSISCVWTLRP